MVLGRDFNSVYQQLAGNLLLSLKFNSSWLFEQPYSAEARVEGIVFLIPLTRLPLGPLGFECSQHRQTLRPTRDGTRSKALRPFGS